MWQIFALTAFGMLNKRDREAEILADERRLLGQLGDERVPQEHRSPVSGPSVLERLAGSFRKGVQDDHSLTDYPCRLPDGTMGRVAAIEHSGEWSLVCRRA
jgi:hypothetical protein